MKDLLVAIAHHSTPGRQDYLERVLAAFDREYEQITLDVVIDTDSCQWRLRKTLRNIQPEIVIHASLEHPFFLTWQHRKHFKANLLEYEWLLYLEDDLYLPFPNFQRYQANFPLLWPNAVPSFVRIEEQNGVQHALDQTRPQICQPIEVAGRLFCALEQPYCACWCLPATALRSVMSDAFTRLSDSREAAASYPMADLGKTPLVQIEQVNGRYQIHPECLVQHLPNNYSREPSSPHGKIPVQEIFVK